jgi:thiol-disulfide isomerase/thioredoxin
MVKYAIAALVIAIAATHSALGEVVMLDFASPTCGPCQQMIPTVESLAAAGYKVRRVDVTQEPQLAQQFGVTQVPCFVVLVDGREANRMIGATSRQQLEQMLRAAQPPAAPPAPPQAAPAASPPVQLTSATAAPAADPWSGVSRNDIRLQSQDPAQPSSPDEFSAKLISSTVRLRVDDPAGHSYGTGTIIDARSGEALVITCGHLFRDSAGKGPIMVELFAATPEGVRVVGQVAGQVVDYNLDRDIGLVSIRPEGEVHVAPIAPVQTVMERGDRVTSVGCNEGKDPTALSTRVTNVDRYQGPPNIEAGGAPIEGRSGGGLFNSAGQLVGVCFAADYEGNEGLYTALDSIHQELDHLGLSDIYRGANANSTAANQSTTPPATALATATPPVFRGQEPQQPVMPIDDGRSTVPAAFAASVTQNSSTATTTPPAELNNVEQAAMEEIMTRAVDAEVICIIRPRDAGGKSEVISLDRVSPEFIHTLEQRTSRAPTTLTR